MEAPEWLGSPGEIATLRQRLLKAAIRRGLPPGDAEDVVQETLLKMFREPSRPDAPSRDKRAFAALRDKRIEFARATKRERHWRVPWSGAEPGETVPPVAPLNQAEEIAIIDASDLISRIVGPDAMNYAILTKLFNLTERDVADVLGWTQRRTAAARVQFARKRLAIIEAVRAATS